MVEVAVMMEVEVEVMTEAATLLPTWSKQSS